jgi:subtilisin family serine protease
MDTMAICLNALPVYAGKGLPQAYKGRGVVVGVMDIGFDLTHPNFYSRDTTEYRISRFWDMLSADTIGSRLYVGRDYSGREELLALGHSRDGLDQTHGTHTTGIAAGSGYDSPFIGMAPESDICLVANAVTEDTVFIDPADYDKYTFATDALGFKYIFDYAESQGKPCVINFSEGSGQDFIGYDVLYYEMLARLTGPGRIIVSAAGNNGMDKSWFRKRRGEASAGTFLRAYKHSGMLTLKAADNFELRMVAYGANYNDTLTVDTRQVMAQEDSTLTAVLRIADDSVSVMIEAYPSCYDEHEMCYDIGLEGNHSIGSIPPLSVEVMGREADVEVYRVSAKFVENALNPKLNAGELSHSVLSPGSAPCVLCVGSTAYRTSIVNDQGEVRVNDDGTGGVRSPSSAIGPTYDGRIKPDVMAPGVNVISSYSSYYMENHPDAADIGWNVQHFDFRGRTYPWNCNSGTSMASPALAGVIALWLEACPTLSPDDILGVLERTCHHNDRSLSYPNNYYGYGEVDAYRGLLDILGLGKIEGLSTHPTKARIVVADGVMEVVVADASAVPSTVSVYSLSGKLVAKSRMPAGSSRCRLALGALRPGEVCVVQIDGDAAFSGSMLVRWGK